MDARIDQVKSEILQAQETAMQAFEQERLQMTSPSISDSKGEDGSSTISRESNVSITGIRGPPKKRRKWNASRDPANGLEESESKIADKSMSTSKEKMYLERIAECEQQLQEQRTEMMSLRVLIHGVQSSTSIDESSSETPDRAVTTDKENASNSHMLVMDTSASSRSSSSPNFAIQDKIGDEPMAIEGAQETQPARSHLATASTIEHRYKAERDEFQKQRDVYKNKLTQVHQLITRQLISLQQNQFQEVGKRREGYEFVKKERDAFKVKLKELHRLSTIEEKEYE